MKVEYFNELLDEIHDIETRYISKKKKHPLMQKIYLEEITKILKTTKA